MSRTIVLGANSSWNLLNFRASLICRLKNEGYSVAAAVPLDNAAVDLERMVDSIHRVPLDARGLSPLRDAALLAGYCRMFRRLRPAAFLGFTAKPNIYGSIAADLFGVPAINTITGLGTGFLSGRTLEWTITGLYRLSLRRSARVFFHNPEDLELFASRSLVDGRRAEVVPGSGVNLSHFAPVGMARSERSPSFLFIGRLLKDKGALEFAQAAAIVRRADTARFTMLGSVEAHPKAVSRNLLQPFVSNGTIEIVPPVSDVRPYIANADCIVLPSYREGMPRVILEASSMGKPVICTDVAGCRQAVEDGVTGILCDARSARALATAITAMIRMSLAERTAMGARAREKAEREFSEDLVAEAYLRALAAIGI